MGHSMGGLTLNTYLGLNPHIAERLAGVVYSAPFFGMSEEMHVDFAKRFIIKSAAGLLDEFVMMAKLPLHNVCRDKRHIRSMIA